MLDEVALRRPGFFPGTTTRLADGQHWTLPGTSCPGCCGDEYEALLDVIREAGDEAEQFRGELALAIYLLECNYRLTPACYQALLENPTEGTLLCKMQEAFRGVAAVHVELRTQKLRQSEGGCPARSFRALSRIFGFAHSTDRPGLG